MTASTISTVDPPPPRAASLSRRSWLAAAGTVAANAIAPRPGLAAGGKPAPNTPQPAFRISLCEWSLHRDIFADKLSHLDVAKTARRTFGIEGIEYVNQFFKDKPQDADYLAELAKRASDEGVTGLIVICDALGSLGDPDEKARRKAIEHHFPWVEAAKRLGCHAIRVVAASRGTFEEQQKLVTDGLVRLAEYAAQMQLAVLVENQGGLSSNGEWLAGVMRMVNRPNCGTLPDFGSFHDYDRYRGVEELMPFARGIHAKSHEFDADGAEVRTDYHRMLRLVVGAGYRGWVGIDYEGKSLSEADGIRATKKLLERVRTDITA
jgi:sugar phosphate isomerase/epimerase